MIRLKKEPKDGKIGRVLICQTAGHGEALGLILDMGYKPCEHHEIDVKDAEETPHILIAIGSKVPHPNSKKPSFFGFQKKKIVHVLEDLGVFLPDFEIAIKAA